MIFSITFSVAQNKADSIQPTRNQLIKYAYRNLNGVGVTLSYMKAYNIFKQLAEDGDAEACNALGMMYKHGLGVKQNDIKALHMFAVAAQRGYAKAAYNLGIAYKNGHGVEQDFTKAARLFDRAAEMGFKDTDYAIAYSYHKGQGRKQNYKKAIEYFEAGAEKGNASCMFYLGYSYLKGYGVERNVEQGKFWIEQAANKGMSRAVDFIARVDPHEYGKPRTRLKANPDDKLSAQIPLRCLPVENTSNIVQNISGEWIGKLITYDWSGEIIEEETELKVVFENDNNNINGLWVENEENPIKISAISTDSTWIFDNTLLHENKRPLEMKNGQFKLEYKDGIDYLVGNISLYSEVTRENTPPNYVILQRSTVSQPIIADEAKKTAQAYPNPFADMLTIRFNAVESENIQISIFDIAGKQVYNQKESNVSAGENQININTSQLSKGSYVLRLAGESTKYSTIIIK
ncbi:T9SS type A sorting domain-containing protein [Dysgonomonas macrotermitis]|nr:T9SS type A sorting domain-containing protein [Dysgonomonas macrotermitis]